jgi:hypothetical protein
MEPIAELGLDLVREGCRQRLPEWDPRLWQPSVDELECATSATAARLRVLGLCWAKRHLEKRILSAGAAGHARTDKQAKTRPSHGRPQGERELAPEKAAPEDGRKGGPGRAQAKPSTERGGHPNGLIDMKGRIYDTRAGRFMSPDPIMQDAVRRFEQRNIEKYGDPLGPSIDQLRKSGKTWEQIIESATRPGGGDLGL